MRQFCIIVTREGRLRLKFLKVEHGLLHDTKEQKSYAIIREAYPTNWAGRWSRAYVIHEAAAQTVRVHDDEVKVDGGTVELVEPLNMVAKIRMPGRRGEGGEVRDVQLTAESIYDRTLSVQVRRLGNRRFQWFHALLFVSLGIAICLALVTTISLLSAGGDDAPPAGPGVVIPSPGAGAAQPQSGPVPTTPSPVVLVRDPPPSPG